MYDFYENPLCTRYAGRKMQEIFGDRHRIGLWRRLWLALAESEKELGLSITEDQLNEMREHMVPSDEEFAVAAEREKAVFHDVMSHIYAFGEVCPKAKPIIHLGATSCFVTDNSELIQMYEGLEVIKGEPAEQVCVGECGPAVSGIYAFSGGAVHDAGEEIFTVSAGFCERL